MLLEVMNNTDSSDSSIWLGNFIPGDGVVVRASASQSVDLGFIPKSSHTKRLQKMVFTASLLGAQHKKGGVENKPASLLVVFLGKALNGTPPPLCGRQVAHPYFTGLQL